MSKNSNTKPFFALYAWMVKRLKLKNYDLLIYALIFSFSRTGKGAYQGSIEYICKRLGVSVSTVIRSLHDLVNKGYIQKFIVSNNGKRYAIYSHSEKCINDNQIYLNSDDNSISSGYFIVYDWMIEKYNLSGHKLTVYALLYCYSKNLGYYTGNNVYIAKRLNLSTKQVARIISELISMGILKVLEEYDPHTRTAKYTTDVETDEKPTENKEKTELEQLIDFHNAYYNDLENSIKEVNEYYERNLSEDDFEPENPDEMHLISEMMCVTDDISEFSINNISEIIADTIEIFEKKSKRKRANKP